MSKKEKEINQRMVYCDGPAVGAKPIHNVHHKGLHYALINEGEDTPKGFRDTMVATKTKKPTKAELAAIKEAEEEAELAAMEAEEAAKKAKEA